jgi:hypothetical protein
VSRDGSLVAIREPDGIVTLVSTNGKPPRRLEGERGRPVHWTADGHLVLVGPEPYPAQLYRRHVITGKIEPWRTVGPSDPTGVMSVGSIFIADDDRFYAYNYSRALNELYLLRDVR